MRRQSPAALAFGKKSLTFEIIPEPILEDESGDSPSVTEIEGPSPVKVSQPINRLVLNPLSPQNAANGLKTKK